MGAEGVLSGFGLLPQRLLALATALRATSMSSIVELTTVTG